MTTLKQVGSVSNKLIPKQSWAALAILWLMFAINANGREILNRLLPYITDSYHLSGTQAGYLGTAAFLGTCLASIPMSRLADRYGSGWKRKKVLLIFAIGYMACTAICGFSILTTTFAAILLIQFLRGAFSGAGDCCEVGTVAEWWPKEKSGFALGFHHSGYPWGAFIGGLIISGALVLVGDDNWRSIFFIFPIIGIIIWIIMWKYFTPQNYAKFEKNTVDAGMTCPLTSTGNQEEDKVIPGAFGRCVKNPNIFITTIASIFCHYAYIGFNFWMPLYLTYCADYSYTAAASLSIVFTLTGGLGQIIWGYLSDKIGTKRVLLICSLWLAVGFFLMQYISISIVALVGLQLFIGCCTNAVYPVMYNYIAHSAEPGTMVTAYGIMNTGLYFGACVSTVIIGWIIDLGGGLTSITGYYTGLYSMVIAMVITITLFFFFTHEVTGPRVGKDFALVSFKSCNLDKQ